MFKMILASIVAIGFSSVAFANEATTATTTTPPATGQETTIKQDATEAMNAAKEKDIPGATKAGKKVAKKGMAKMKDMKGHGTEAVKTTTEEAPKAH